MPRAGIQLTLVAVAASLACLAVATASAQAAFPGPNGRIAFHRGFDSGAQVFSISPDGGTLAAFAGSPSPSSDAAFSPNGARIAFTAGRLGAGDVYVVNSDGSGLGLVTSSPADDSSPAWSPDGSRLAFVSNRAGNREIYVVNVDGSGLTRMTDNPALDGDPAWSPDGTKIAFSSDRSGPGNLLRTEIYTRPAAGGSAVPTPLTRNDVFDAEPNWSPNGARIAFTRATAPDQADVVTMSSSGGGEVNLTNADQTFDVSPAFSPDGTQIAFARIDSGIYAMPVSGGAARAITSGSDSHPDWGPLQPVAAATAAPSAPASALPAVAPATGITPGLTIGRSPLALRRGVAAVRIACSRGAGPVRGVLTLRSVAKLPIAGRRTRRQLKLGSARFACAGGRTVVVRVRLSGTARRALTRTRRLRVLATASARGTTGSAASRTTLTLKVR